MRHLKKIFSTNIKSGLFKNESSIDIIEELVVLLHDIKKEKKEKIFINILFKESYLKYVHNYNLKNEFYENKITAENSFDTLQSRIDLVVYKINELYDCLKEKIIFQSKHCALKIQEKLENIYDIVFIIFRSDISKLKIDFFFNIYLYYNYIKENIIIKKHKLKSNLLVKKFLNKTFNLDISKLNQVLKLVSTKQEILGDYIYEFCYKTYLHKLKNETCNINQKCIFYKNVFFIKILLL